VHSDYAACNAFDMMDEIGDVAAPALVVVGEHDRLTPPAYAQHLACSLPNATLEIVPNAGHMVMLEQPNAVNDAVRRFMNRWNIER
jgi:pimeloyl-ACP methyl ester carboxylesterase